MTDAQPEAVVEDKRLTIDELIARWRNRVSRGTLANWRSLKRGPAWTKIGRTVLYPESDVIAYEALRTTGGQWWKPGKGVEACSQN